MAPSGGRTAARTRRNSENLKLKKTNKTKKKKQQQKLTAPATENDAVECSDDIDGGCSTPRAERFRIPEIVTCPPAPKKQRPVSVSDCSFRRSPIAFFAPPELELLFFFALPDIPV